MNELVGNNAVMLLSLRACSLHKIILFGVLMGCSGDGTDAIEPFSSADFFSDYAELECEILYSCDAESFDDRFEDHEECLSRSNDADFCTVIDEQQAGLCIDVLQSLSCEDLNGDWYLPSLLNCNSAMSCETEGR